MTQRWRLSNDAGAALGADDLVGALESHHTRVAQRWAQLAPEQWTAPSRNTGWSLHDTARHVADTIEVCAAGVRDEPSRLVFAGFDPLQTPDEWIALSADESPRATIERFTAAAERLRERVAQRMAAGDRSTLPTPYGPAHWTMNVVHVFWDSWLHERDMLLPLGLLAECSDAELRLAGLYGLVMAMAAIDGPVGATVRLTGPWPQDIEITKAGGIISSAEVDGIEPRLRGDARVVTDALSGRGVSVHEALPGAPDELTHLASLFNPA